MNILITGVTGFIGKAFASLLADKHLLYGVTRTSPLSKVNYIPVVVDLLDLSFQHFLPEDIDVVVHFAQSSKYRDFPDGVADMLRINVGATVDLLEWARQTGVKQFFLLQPQMCMLLLENTWSRQIKQFLNHFMEQQNLQQKIWFVGITNTFK